jgi:hypothetical protein
MSSRSHWPVLPPARKTISFELFSGTRGQEQPTLFPTAARHNSTESTAAIGSDRKFSSLWRLLHDGESDNRKLEVRVAHTVNDAVLYTVYYFPQNASGQWNTERDGARNSWAAHLGITRTPNVVKLSNTFSCSAVLFIYQRQRQMCSLKALKPKRRHYISWADHPIAFHYKRSLHVSSLQKLWWQQPNNITKKRGRRMIINHKTEEAGTTTTNQGHIMGSFRIRTQILFFSKVT